MFIAIIPNAIPKIRHVVDVSSSLPLMKYIPICNTQSIINKTKFDVGLLRNDIYESVQMLCIAKTETPRISIVNNTVTNEISTGRFPSNHSTQAIGTLIDYNRGGVPLMELVTEPDISSAEEAVEFLTTLRQRLIFADVAECKMEQGGMRCDVNVSVKPKGSNTLGARTEMKNVNSFKSVYRAIKYESNRQIEIIENGGTITQETRKWDDNHGKSVTMRKKETSQDYRYFPDPDMLAVEISREEVQKIKDSLPPMPEELKKKYIEEYKLTEYDADVITKDRDIIKYFEDTIKLYNNPKVIANWLLTDILSKIKDEENAEIKISSEKLAKILTLLEQSKISRTVAKEIFAKVWDDDADVDKLAKEMGGSVDEDSLKTLISNIIANNPKAVEDYHTSDTPEKVFRWFVGQVMKETRGKANAPMAEQIIKDLLK